MAGYDLSGDIGSIGRINGGPAALTVTGIDKSAFERIGGLRDGGMAYTAYFNPGTGAAHDRFSALPTTNQITTYLRGTGVGSPAASMTAKQLNYDGTRADDGAFTFEVEALSTQHGVQWGVQLSDGLQVDTAATDGETLDDGAASAFGLQAFLHVTAFTGTSVTVKLQDSADDDTWADVVGGGFTAATGITSERITTAADLAVERYLRVVTSGTFSSASFVVTVARNPVAVSF